MQKSLQLQSYEIPETFAPEAKDLCKTLVTDIEKTHDYYRKQIEFIKQRYKIALSALKRPASIAAISLNELFDESEMTVDTKENTEIEDSEPKSDNQKKRKKKKSAIPDHLPRTIVEHDVLDEKKICAEDGEKLKPMGYDVKLELKYHRARFEVIEHRYPKYSCSSCKGAPLRETPALTLIPQSYASSELLAHIAVAKFCNHLPLYRQEQIFGREGIHLTRQVMADWMIKLGEALKPLIGIMHEKILEAPVVHADETPVKVLTEAGIRTSHQAYMWQMSRWGPKSLIIFEFDMTRKKEVAERLLGTYEGFVQTDAYAGYNLLFKDNQRRIHVGCMAHVTRKFKAVVASTNNKELRMKHPANKIIRMIADLYKIEDICRPFEPQDRYLYRLEQGAEGKFDEITEFVAQEKISVAASSPYYEALNYAHKELPHIRHYLKHGFIEIDNNRAENAIRPFALGRRNWMFMCTEDGAQASANIYSILITAKANGIEPTEYLTHVIKNLPYCKSLEDFEALLPT